MGIFTMSGRTRGSVHETIRASLLTCSGDPNAAEADLSPYAAIGAVNS